MSENHHSHNEKLLNASDVGELLNCSKRSVCRYAAASRIPSPIQLSGSKKWKLSDISLFLECNCDMAEYQTRKEAENVS